MTQAFAGSLFAALVAATAMATPAAAGESAFGCRDLHLDRTLPTLEGREGMFFRLTQDIGLQRRFSDHAVADMAALSRALAARGTTLILAIVPTKAMTMPHLLPQTADHYGYDLDTALHVHRDVHARLEAAGVITVDLQPAMAEGAADQPPFFRTDTHWNAEGARRAARAVADVIRAQDGYAALPKTRHETVSLGPVTKTSAMRDIIQTRCRDALPQAVTTLQETRIATPGSGPAGQGDAPLDIGLGEAPIDIGLDDAPLDIGLDDPPLDIGLDDAPLDIGLDDAPLDIGLGDAAETAMAGPGTLPVAVVGTSFSDMPEANFPGFIAQYSDLEAVNYAITGGGQYSAITSYLTSDDFQTAPPSFLVWEAPGYLNPINHGDQPMRELAAAASGACTDPLPLTATDRADTLRAALPAHAGPETTLFLDTGSRASQSVAFRFAGPDGRSRTRMITREDRVRLTGRFYMPLTALWSQGASAVEVTAVGGFGPQPRLFTCRQPQT